MDCKNVGDGTLNVCVEQGDRKIKPHIKRVNKENAEELEYEINFVPETEDLCRIEIEFSSDDDIYGDIFKLAVKSSDFLVIPFPLPPFSVNKNASFNGNLDAIKFKFIIVNLSIF